MRLKKRYDVWELVLALALAFMMVCGLSMSFIPKQISLTGPIREHLSGVIIVFVLFLIAHLCLIKSGFKVLDKNSVDSIDDYHSVASPSWIKTSVVILVCWLPYLVICYPAVTRGYDYFWQILMGTGVFPLSNHHPVLSSLIIGILYRTGASFGGASFGLAFSMFIQSIVLAFSAGYSLSYIVTANKVGKKTFLVMLFMISFSPVFPGHAMFLVKDSLFTAFGILFFTQFYIRVNSLLNAKKIPLIASYPAIIMVGAFFSLYRNGTKPITLTLFAMLLFVELHKGNLNYRNLLKWSTSLIVFLIMMFSWNLFLSAKDVFPTDKREALSMPTRQIIRTIQLHPKALTTENEKILRAAYQRKLSFGMSISDVVDQYDDMNADYIKIDYVEESDFLSRYIKLWISLGVSHPGSYVDAFLRGTDGYWYPMKNPHLEAQGVIIHTVCTTSPEEDFANPEMRQRQFKALFFPTVRSLEYAGIDIDQTFEDLFPAYPWLENLMNVKSPFPEGRKKLGQYLATMETVPIVSLLLAPGTYFWIMIICFAYMFSRKKSGRFLWPILMIEAIAWLSPVNGYSRYVLLIEFYSILMVGMCFENTHESSHFVKS